MSQRKLIVVSNRLPVSINKSGEKWKILPSSGGLVSALAGLKPDLAFDWVGWAGAEVPKKDQDGLRQLLSKKHKYFPVFLSQSQIERFYDGFSNRVLWPLFHYMPDRMNFNLRYWDNYKEVNRRFAKEVLARCDDNSIVWIHDYHLFLLPEILRKERPGLRIGFFLHIPFPSSEIYRALPVREEVLRGVLGADLIGFQTHEYLRHFNSACLRVLGLESEPESIEAPERIIHTGAYPIGINPSEFLETLESPPVKKRKAQLNAAYKGKKIIIGIDRLDYIKGLKHKFDAFELFLERFPDLREKVVLIQVVVPSRGNVEEYQQLKEELDRDVGRINGRFGGAQHTPIHYIARSVPFEELCALYELSDAALITSVRDGMNLVSFEYVASHRGEGGVLILSEFAGAAHTFSEAIQVNPWNRSEVADAIYQAVTMDRREQKRRAKKNFEYVEAFSSAGWSRRFLKDLTIADTEQLAPAEDLRTHYIDLQREFSGSYKRILLLDYDGTLCPLVSRPEQANPDKELTDLLTRLAANDRNEVYVISGRGQSQLDDWIGDIPGLGIGAEHGLFYRSAGKSQWIPMKKISTGWKRTVLPILENYVRRTPGSAVEIKKGSLAWHYRNAEEVFGEWQAHELLFHLEESLSRMPVEVIRGNKVLEVRSRGINKGTLVNGLIEKSRKDSMIICFGDDKTDEDMFKALPSRAWTCKVGLDRTHARFMVDTSQAVREVLWELSTF